MTRNSSPTAAKIDAIFDARLAQSSQRKAATSQAKVDEVFALRSADMTSDAKTSKRLDEVFALRANAAPVSKFGSGG